MEKKKIFVGLWNFLFSVFTCFFMDGVTNKLFDKILRICVGTQSGKKERFFSEFGDFSYFLLLELKFDFFRENM
jgi:hypothetical protein